MTYLKKTGFMIFLTAVLMSIIFLGIRITVVSQTEISKQAMNEYYKEAGKEYSLMLRTYLDKIGYSNSGVTLTRTIDTDGTATYKATIHHKAIDRLALQQKQELLKQLDQTAELSALANVFYELLDCSSCVSR